MFERHMKQVCKNKIKFKGHRNVKQRKGQLSGRVHTVEPHNAPNAYLYLSEVYLIVDLREGCTKIYPTFV